ncbi:MAG: GGDEF domain-containing protein [Gaiellaceae bacterium]
MKSEHRLAVRDRAAHERDRAADERDEAADERDEAADERDRAAEEREQTTRLSSANDREQATQDREHAAADRADAARDRERASLDDLTGALRRDRGLADLQREVDRARRADGRLVLAFVDIDRLKAINDTQGHAAGDRLLRDVVAMLKGGLRSYDLVIRYGGDEFVCALPDTDVDTAQSRLDQVRKALAERRPGRSVSVGLAALRSGETLSQLTARADAALYANRRRAQSRQASLRAV